MVGSAALCAVPTCTAQEQGRRRLQLGAGSCPHATFLSKAAAMKTTCGLEAGAAALPPSCASTDCARQLLSLLDECTESIDRAAGEEADFYAALEGSALYAACVELDQSAATFAAVKVEFRAPSRLVADRLITEHEKLAADMATVFTAGCAAPPAGACDGRRQLEHCEQAVDEIAALRAQLRRVTDERAAAIGERDAAVGELQRVASELEAAVGELGTVIGERDTLLETVMEQGAFKVSGRQEVSKNFSGVETASAVGVRQQATSSTPEPKVSGRQEVSKTPGGKETASAGRVRRNETSSRRLQADAEADALAAVRTADGAVKACAAAPCALAGACLNGGAGGADAAV